MPGVTGDVMESISVLRTPWMKPVKTSSLAAAAFADREPDDELLNLNTRAGRLYCAGSSSHGAIGVSITNNGPGGKRDTQTYTSDYTHDECLAWAP